jgi:hypothetical protein
VKSYFLAKEQSHKHPVNDLKYPKGLVSNPEYKDNLVNRTSSTPPLTNYSSKGYSKNGNRATTPQNTKITALNLSPNIFNKVMPIEINQKLKSLRELKSGF